MVKRFLPSAKIDDLESWNVRFGRNAWFFLATGEVETAAHARARGQVGGQPFDSVMHLLCVTFKN